MTRQGLESDALSEWRVFHFFTTLGNVRIMCVFIVASIAWYNVFPRQIPKPLKYGGVLLTYAAKDR